MNRHNFWRFVLILVLAVVGLSLEAAIGPVAGQEQPVRIIFMHHSTGEGVIWEGNLREQLAHRDYEFWDHGYNSDGLVDGAGNWLEVNWAVPDDNTDPDGWYHIFSQPFTDPPSNTLSHMLAYDVILFKSCFPASDIDSEETFEEYRRYYLSIRDVMDQYPDKLFVPFTTPPLVPNGTSAENAARARRWADYLTSEAYSQGHPNVHVFDFFDHLADEAGYLKAEFRVDEWDSHPNALANKTVSTILADFLDEAILDFVPGKSVTRPVPASDVAQTDGEVAAQSGQEEVVSENVVTFDQIGDFENATVDFWWDWAENASFSWATVKPGYMSDHALQLTFDVATGGYGGIGVNFEPDAAWEAAEGISFYWKTDQPGSTVVFALAVQDPNQPNAEPSDAAPFEVPLVPASEDWTRVTIPWAKFVKAQWFGDAGVDEFDPGNVIWLAFDLGSWEQAQKGTLWIDDISLMVAD